MAEAQAARQEKWYDPTYSHGMTPEERDVFLGSPDSSWLLKLAVLKPDGWPFVTPMAGTNGAAELSTSSGANVRSGFRI